MSLKRLMKNFMTIETYSNVQTKDGSIDRAGTWHPIEEFKNVRCNIQERSKQTVTERFSRLEEEHNDLFYHLNAALYAFTPSTAIRIIVNRSDPQKPLSFPVTDLDIKIYEFKGHVYQIKHHKKRFYILRAEQSEKWNR